MTDPKTHLVIRDSLVLQISLVHWAAVVLVAHVQFLACYTMDMLGG